VVVGNSKVERARLAYQPALDGVRAIAVGAVVLFHGTGPRLIGGYVGVDVFFVLSGYLITTLLIREKRSTDRISLAGFWERRVRRLAPALLAVSVVVLIAFGLDEDARLREETLVGVPTAIAYLTAWVIAFGWWEVGWMAPTWSLSVEETFYALFPLGVVAMARRVGIRWVYVATGVAVAYYLAAGNLWGWSTDRIYHGPDTRAQQLLIGCTLAVILDRARRDPPIWVTRLAAATATLVLVAWSVAIDWTAPATIRGGQTLIAVCAAAIIWFVMTAPTGRAGRVLASTALVWIGRRSYTLYLIHYPLFGLIVVPGPTWITFAVVIGLSVAYAGASYSLIERRFLASRAAVDLRGSDAPESEPTG
jgi:peptidoglycan/LPS O-acetylase OafA/YrhL